KAPTIELAITHERTIENLLAGTRNRSIASQRRVVTSRFETAHVAARTRAGRQEVPRERSSWRATFTSARPLQAPTCRAPNRGPGFPRKLPELRTVALAAMVHRFYRVAPTLHRPSRIASSSPTARRRAPTIRRRELALPRRGRSVPSRIDGVA